MQLPSLIVYSSIFKNMAEKNNYKEVCNKILSTLPQKQREVLEKRFGLVSSKRETLQKIGDGFGVTRERVRQVESEAFSKLRQQEEDLELKNVFAKFVQYLKTQGGLKREDILLSELGKDGLENHVLFLFTLGEGFHRISEDNIVYSFWAITPDISSKAKLLVAEIAKKFYKTSKSLTCEQVLANSQNKELLLRAIEIAKLIEEGPLGNIGLTSWPEIKPRGVRDAAFLCLKKESKPLHFRDIAVLSGKLKGEFFAKRKILPQTVHNELIRDPRFVLVGRGVYALKEWGYEEGTVKDVIYKILSNAKQPLPRQEVVELVLEKRVVKPNTVFLNLNNQANFHKDSKGRYTVKSS